MMSDINCLEQIREQIRELFETDPLVHVNLSLTQPKVHLQNVSVEIKGVYPHLFRVEEKSSGRVRQHNLQYKDVFSGHVQIIELENL